VNLGCEGAAIRHNHTPISKYSDAIVGEIFAADERFYRFVSF